MEDKYTESDIHIKSPFLEKLENFWFYYKIHTIVVLFIAFVLIVCVAQSCSKENADVKVMYAGRHYFTSEELETVRAELNSVLPKDFDGNGKKYTDVVTYHVMDETQLREYEEEIKNLPKEDQIQIDRTYFTTEAQNFNHYIMTGDCGVFLLDIVQYNRLISLDNQHIVLKPLSDLFDEIPASAVGDYGIKFSETALYKNSTMLKQLPEDTVLCLSRPIKMGSSNDPKIYSRMTEMFLAMAQE